MKNVLVIKLRYIGDVLLATPVLRALRDQLPSAGLTMVVNRGTEEILRRNEDVTDVLAIERGGLGSQIRFLKDLRRRGFDCVIDLTDGDRSAVLSRITGAPIRVGFNEEHSWRGLMYSVVVRADLERMHRIERNLEALRAIGIDAKSTSLVLNVSHEDEEDGARVLEQFGLGQPGRKPERRLVMLQPGARYWFKAWPAERFAALADRLSKLCDCTVLVGGTPGEQLIANEIRERARSAPTVLAGRTTLMQHAAILQKCALFIGNDNGPMHMAATLGVPVVALFGPSDPAIWGPRGGKATVIYKGLDCRRCFHPTCYRGEESCMRLISVDEVFTAAQRLLANGSANAQREPVNGCLT